MNKEFLRKKIRSLIFENDQKLSVVKCIKIGLDHLNKFRIHLSNGSIDYADSKNILITSSIQADYKCSNLEGIIKSESNLEYRFTGVNCDGYVWINAKSIQLIN